MNHIEIRIPHDRRHYGILSVWVKDRVVFQCDCYTKADQAKADAHNNPERDPVLPWGDFPAGRYTVVIDSDEDRDRVVFGENERLRLIGYRGDAALAVSNGRTGIMVHGGRTSSTATYGCVRVADDNMRRLIGYVRAHGLDKLVAVS